MVRIHPTAIVESGALLGKDVCIGAFSIVEKNVSIGDGTLIESSAVIRGRTTIGENNRISSFAVLGVRSQDLKDKNEPTELLIGSGNTIREFATIHLSTSLDNPTIVGDGCLIMSYVHIAHDCKIGDRVILANAVNLAGHIQIQDDVYMGGLSAGNQFTKIGKHAFIGGYSAVRKDVPPYTRGEGNPYRVIGINSIGLKRKGFSDESISAIKHIFKKFYYSKMSFSEAVKLVSEKTNLSPEQKVFVDFVKNADRGISK